MSLMVSSFQFQSGFSGITTSSNSVHQQPLKTPLLPTHIDSDFMNDLRQVEEAKAQETYDQIVRYCREVVGEDRTETFI